jgi:hypothetical protein
MVEVDIKFQPQVVEKCFNCAWARLWEAEVQSREVRRWMIAMVRFSDDLGMEDCLGRWRVASLLCRRGRAIQDRGYLCSIVLS